MKPIVIVADNLWDGTGAAVRRDATVQVTDGRIDHVIDCPPPTGVFAEIHHLSGCTILPGLIDTHVHLVMSALDTNEEIIAQVDRETDDELLQRALANARAALGAGITTVRDCGGRGTVIQQT